MWSGGNITGVSSATSLATQPQISASTSTGLTDKRTEKLEGSKLRVKLSKQEFGKGSESLKAQSSLTVTKKGMITKKSTKTAKEKGVQKAKLETAKLNVRLSRQKFQANFNNLTEHLADWSSYVDAKEELEKLRNKCPEKSKRNTEEMGVTETLAETKRIKK